MTSSTEKRADDLNNQLGEIAQNFVGFQKQLFNEASIKAVKSSVLTLMHEIAVNASELTAEKVGDIPGATYILARGVADALQEQSDKTPILSAHPFAAGHLRKQAGEAERAIFKGIDEMYDRIGDEKIDIGREQAAKARAARLAHRAPGK